MIGTRIGEDKNGSKTWDLEGHFSDPTNPDRWIHMSTIRRTHTDSPVPNSFGTFMEDFGKIYVISITNHKYGSGGGACYQGFCERVTVQFLDPWATLDGDSVSLNANLYGDQWQHYTWMSDVMGDSVSVRITSCNHPNPLVDRALYHMYYLHHIYI